MKHFIFETQQQKNIRSLKMYSNLNLNRFLSDFLDTVGLANSSRCHSKGVHRFQKIFVGIQWTITIVYHLAHLYSTLTRSTAYIPELFKRFLEDERNLPPCAWAPKALSVNPALSVRTIHHSVSTHHTSGRQADGCSWTANLLHQFREGWVGLLEVSWSDIWKFWRK